MVNRRPVEAKPESARVKVLRAALGVIRAKGYSATTVEELCMTAGVTKGAFFHHFDNKEALAVAAAGFWTETTSALFAAAAYHLPDDPLDRVLAYIDFRSQLLNGPPEAFTCLVGTMVQDVFDTSPAIREACRASIVGHAETLEADIEAAMARHNVVGVSARSLALHTQAVLQGAFILAKAHSGQKLGGTEVAAESISHLKRYFMLLFQYGQSKGETR